MDNWVAFAGFFSGLALIAFGVFSIIFL